MTRKYNYKPTHEKYADFKKDFSFNYAKCTFERNNGSCSLTYDGHVAGTYSNSEFSKILDCFVKVLKELPITVSLSLENKITESDEGHKLLFIAAEKMNQLREETIPLLKEAAGVGKISGKRFPSI
jgi:hypothetical protein